MVGANNRQLIIHMSKRMVYFYTTDEKINRFLIGYMIKSSLHIKKVFREQVEKLLRAKFNENKK